VDFLLVLIELFFARCYSWGAASEYRLIIGVFAQTGSVWPKISGRRGRPHQASCRKTRVNDLSCGKNNVGTFFVLSQITRLTDGR